MISDALDALRALTSRLGRDPSYIELLQALGHRPAGLPVAGVGDPGYPSEPNSPSMMLGPVESDAGLSALLAERELREAHPDLERMRAQLVHQLLFGLDLPTGGPQGLAGPMARPAHGLAMRPDSMGPGR